MNNNRVLTGITTTGTPHLGNYVGAIRPAVAASQDDNVESFLFLADLHAQIKCHDPDHIHQSTKEIAASWLALGLNPDKTVFYRQSDIPEISELSWTISCMTAKGLMNRAVAYKAAVDKNAEDGEDTDFGVTMGLYSYPVLMAADILIFNAHKVPVGRDQTQHLEMARDIAQRFNHHFGEIFVLPQAVVDDKVAVLKGLDGRKMSKSYNNTIPIFLTEKQLKKHINKIKTNLLEPGEPKDPEDSIVFEVWKAFATEGQTAEMHKAFENGIAWGEAKKQLFELVNQEIAPARERYQAYMEDPSSIEKILQEGAQKAREYSVPLMNKVRRAVGIRPL